MQSDHWAGVRGWMVEPSLCSRGLASPAAHQLQSNQGNLQPKPPMAELCLHLFTAAVDRWPHEPSPCNRKVETQVHVGHLCVTLRNVTGLVSLAFLSCCIWTIVSSTSVKVWKITGPSSCKGLFSISSFLTEATSSNTIPDRYDYKPLLWYYPRQFKRNEP